MRITSKGVHYPDKKYAKWRDRICADLRFYLNQIGFVEPINYPCKLYVRYWSGDHRRRDMPAMLDSMFHCFEKAKLVSDDFFIQSLSWIRMGYDKKNPRVECILEEDII